MTKKGMTKTRKKVVWSKAITRKKFDFSPATPFFMYQF